MIGEFSSRIVRISMTVVATAIVLVACQKDDDKQSVNPTIEFLTSEGYTYLNDTVGTRDTLVVGVVIARGTDGMHHFEVTSTYDNGPTVVVDSLPIGADNFEFDKTIITRDVPGTEKWSFIVVENDGDLIRRSLTFVVE
jgi:hypothetical protein